MRSYILLAYLALSIAIANAEVTDNSNDATEDTAATTQEIIGKSYSTSTYTGTTQSTPPEATSQTTTNPTATSETISQQSTNPTTTNTSETTNQQSTNLTTTTTSETISQQSANPTTINTSETTSKQSTNSTTTTMSPSTTSRATTTLSATGYTCASGTPDNYHLVKCEEGCFGVKANGTKTSLGCMSDLPLDEYGFGDVAQCGQNQKDGYCINAQVGVSCIRCCVTNECNNMYNSTCDFTSLDTTCNSSACSIGVASLVLLPLAMLLLNLGEAF